MRVQLVCRLGEITHFSKMREVSMPSSGLQNPIDAPDRFGCVEVGWARTWEDKQTFRLKKRVSQAKRVSGKNALRCGIMNAEVVIGMPSRVEKSQLARAQTNRLSIIHRTDSRWIDGQDFAVELRKDLFAINPLR